MVNTVKKKPDGSFETVKIRVGKNQNAKDRVRSFMVNMFYKAWQKTHSQHVVQFFRGGFHYKNKIDSVSPTMTHESPSKKDRDSHVFSVFAVIYVLDVIFWCQT